MAVKMTGAEWNRFYADPEAWPDGRWHDDEEILVDGAYPGDDFDLSDVRADAAMTVRGGIVFMQQGDDDGPSLEAHFRRWRKKQTTTVLVVEVPHEKAEAIRAAIAASGGAVKA